MTVIPRIFPASLTRYVVEISGWLGDGSPDGCWWAMIRLWALIRIASLKIYLGSTEQLLNVPIVISGVASTPRRLSRSMQRITS